MAYLSNTFVNIEDLYDALIGWMTGTAGWTVIDNIPVSGGRDKVLFSSGINNKMSMLYRIQTNELSGTNPFKNPADPHLKWPYIWARGYSSWNSSSIATPTAVTASAQSGLLPAGTYSYRVSAFNDTGETAASTAAVFVLTGSSGILVNWSAVSGALGYNLYGRSGSAEALIAVVPTASLTPGFSDIGERQQNNAVLASQISASARFGGTNEFGIWGPFMWQGDQNYTTGNQLYYPLAGPRGEVPAFPAAPAQVFAQITNINTQAAVPDMHDRIYGAYSNGLTIIDVGPGPDVTNIDLGQGNQSFQMQGVVVTRDPNGILGTPNEEYVFFIGDNTANMYRYAVNGGGVFQCTPVPAAIQGAPWCWDGGDFIYLARAASTALFFRYSISGNSWTALANIPATLLSHQNVNNGNSSFKMVFVPKTVTGYNNDSLYLCGDSTLIYRYDIPTNTWQSTFTAPAGGMNSGAISLPVAGQQNNVILWDNQRFMYFQQMQNGANFLWRNDITADFPAWVNYNPLDTAIRWSAGYHIQNQIIAKVRASNVIVGGGRYFFLGDQDSVRVVTRLGPNAPSGQYYWMYFGKYDTMYQNNQMGVQAQVGPGTRVSIPVDNNAGFSAGQQVYITSAVSASLEKTTIYSLSGSTFVQANLTGTYPSGSIIAIDPSQHILTSDTGIGCVPWDAAGYKSNFEPAWYYTQPYITNTLSDRQSPSIRNYWMPIPFWIYNNNSYFVANNINQKYETLGFLRNVYTLKKKSFPSPQNEDILTYNGHNYLYFNPQQENKNANDTRGIVIGPIS